MDLEKKLLGALCVLVLTGCHALEQKRYEKIGPPRTSPPMFKDSEIEDMADAVVQIKKQRATELPPMPPEHKMKVRSLAVPTPIVPDRYVVVRWDPSADASIIWRVSWESFPTAWGALVDGFENVTQNKLDLVSLFKARQVPPGWYRIDVCAVNESYVESEPVSVAFFWHPLQ